MGCERKGLFVRVQNVLDDLLKKFFFCLLKKIIMLFFFEKRTEAVCLIHVGNDMYRLPPKKKREKNPFINHS